MKSPLRTILEEGPATVGEIAAELGLPYRVVSNRLHSLKQVGAAYPTDRIVERHPGARGPKPVIWELRK